MFYYERLAEPQVLLDVKYLLYDCQIANFTLNVDF